jgi:hypothetical protein
MAGRPKRRAAAARKGGYTLALARKICDRVAEGDSLAAIAAMPGMPSRRTMRGWLVEHPEFQALYGPARELWVQSVAEDIADLAGRAQQIAEDAARNGGNPNAAIAALRVEIDAKRWLLSKLAPAVFGDHSAVELSGAGGKDLIPAETDNSKLALAILTILRGDGVPVPAELSAEPAEQPAAVDLDVPRVQFPSRRG